MRRICTRTVDLKIRNAALHEAALLSELAFRSKAHWGYSAEFMTACRDELMVSVDKLKSSRFHYFAAECRGQIVGFYALEELSESEIELEALFVEPELIGSGIGRALIRHAIDYAAGLGGNTLIIQGDPNAEKFYLAAGARHSGTRESASIPGRLLPTFTISLVIEDAEG